MNSKNCDVFVSSTKAAIRKSREAFSFFSYDPRRFSSYMHGLDPDDLVHTDSLHKVSTHHHHRNLDLKKSHYISIRKLLKDVVQALVSQVPQCPEHSPWHCYTYRTIAACS